MTDNKLTDEQIIKALETHIELREKEICTPETPLELLKLILDLINRQKIERLKAEVEVYIQLYEDLKTEHCDLISRIKTVKSESRKELAERLKNEIISNTAYGCDTNQHSGYYDYQIKIGDIPEYIDNLLKEMDGE